jgi:hypothetical protein
MYDETVKVIELNNDEALLLMELLKEYSYSSIAERQLVEGLEDKLSD